MQPILRYNGLWYKIIPKPYEVERITFEIAWLKIRENKSYKEWFKKERNISALLYNE